MIENNIGRLCQRLIGECICNSQLLLSDKRTKKDILLAEQFVSAYFKFNLKSKFLPQETKRL